MFPASGLSLGHPDIARPQRRSLVVATDTERRGRTVPRPPWSPVILVWATCKAPGRVSLLNVLTQRTDRAVGEALGVFLTFAMQPQNFASEKRQCLVGGYVRSVMQKVRKLRSGQILRLLNWLRTAPRETVHSGT
jgi:hypothetical protein